MIVVSGGVAAIFAVVPPWAVIKVAGRGSAARNDDHSSSGPGPLLPVADEAGTGCLRIGQRPAVRGGPDVVVTR
ncbi:hypothetical protein GCM10023321_51680 [Pseudonocardia eucalypti]|uniref:Uncharacterized protein n=1 Tax=Pseudonocardia eucalypti TaxID=648755 RepID=A0ABP9QLM2_9PSEU|nr:hypothetical protein [Pseudonocardia eucalypti]